MDEKYERTQKTIDWRAAIWRAKKSGVDFN